MTEQTASPLTDAQLDDVEARAQAATDGPWERYEKYGPDFFACATGSYLRGVGTLNFGDGEDATADEEFVTHAVEDVRALVAEVRRLRAEADELRGENAKLIRWHGEDEKSFDRMRATIARLRARELTASEYNAAWHAVEGAAGVEGADPGTVLHAVLGRLGIEWQAAAHPVATAAAVTGE